jgi:hypothetical protein
MKPVHLPAMEPDIVTSSSSIVLNYVELPCYVQSSRIELQALKSAPFVEFDVFALHLSYYIDTDRELYMGTTQMLAGHTDDGAVVWSSAISFETSIGDRIRVLVGHLMDDWKLNELMIEWLPSAMTPFRPTGEIATVCFPGGIVIENGLNWPYRPDVDTLESLQKAIERFAVIVMDDGLSAHEQIAFLECVETYFRKMIPAIAPCAPPAVIEAAARSVIIKRPEPFETR